MNSNQTNEYQSSAQETAQFLLDKMGEKPEELLIIGSGLGQLVELLEDRKMLRYADIPHFPVSTVVGHSGELHCGRINGYPLCIMKGRFHLYEGYHPRQVVFPIVAAHACGIKKLLITNAAGGINPGFEVGDIMLIRDHINWMFKNPLIGSDNPLSSYRFPDMSDCYSRKLARQIRDIALQEGIMLREGTYLASTGPNYETMSEIAMMRSMGADAVGMSTVPEVLAASALQLEVLGFSYISNVHRLGADYDTTHEEVIRNARLATKNLLSLFQKRYV